MNGHANGEAEGFRSAERLYFSTDLRKQNPELYEKKEMIMNNQPNCQRCGELEEITINELIRNPEFMQKVISSTDKKAAANYLSEIEKLQAETARLAEALRDAEINSTLHAVIARKALAENTRLRGALEEAKECLGNKTCVLCFKYTDGRSKVNCLINNIKQALDGREGKNNER